MHWLLFIYGNQPCLKVKTITEWYRQSDASLKSLHHPIPCTWKKNSSISKKFLYLCYGHWGRWHKPNIANRGPRTPPLIFIRTDKFIIIRRNAPLCRCIRAGKFCINAPRSIKSGIIRWTIHARNNRCSYLGATRSLQRTQDENAKGVKSEVSHSLAVYKVQVGTNMGIHILLAKHLSC